MGLHDQLLLVMAIQSVLDSSLSVLHSLDHPFRQGIYGWLIVFSASTGLRPVESLELLIQRREAFRGEIGERGP